ncbi:membrane protein [Ralstonia sp. A12]|uniref:membrane protein n=1 Tax=Ralstonia sp. A12 TaxID=1217052 RepID=UPI00057549D0|nr:membrane protein [Ralstonia sp. A12]KHK58432.1 membrane protein [Ralstonia sp. A12]
MSGKLDKLRQRIMGLDPNTIGTVLSLLPTILEQANKTIDKFKNRKKTGTEPARTDGATSDPNTRIAELEAAILQQAESVKLLAEQHAITIDALRDEAARLERRLKRMTWLAAIGFVLAIAALIVATQH